MAAWQAHLTQRVVELAAALRAGEACLFNERVQWSRKTFAARDQAEQLLSASLAALRDVLDESLPANAKDTCLTYLDGAIDVLKQPVPEPGATELNPEIPTDKLALEYLQLTLEGRGMVAVGKIRSAVQDGLELQSAYLDVLLPAQREIGRLWHANEVSVAEEHLVTATTHQAMAVLLHTAEQPERNGKVLVSACVPGNVHDMGVRAITNLFQHAGWQTIYLGADMPVKDLPNCIDTFQADLVLLGSTLSTHIEPARTAIAALREHSSRSVKIIVGGAAFDEVPDLWEQLGADAYAADAEAALAAGANLCN